MEYPRATAVRAPPLEVEGHQCQDENRDRSQDFPKRRGVLGAPRRIGDVVGRSPLSVRPARPVPPLEPGVYAHRWFELRDADWPEFVELSTDAWPEFERSFDSQILGLWRSRDVEQPRARALLLTRYPSLAMWERSRGESARSERESALWQRFVRRHQLTDSTVVVITRLLTA